nr:Na+/H+ antiporter NhaA [Candidatus Frankia nodulisporulans]
MGASARDAGAILATPHRRVRHLLTRASRGRASRAPGERRPLPAQARQVAGILRDETVGGALLLAATVLALIWANSAWSDSYHRLVATAVGPSELGGVAVHLHLSLAQWASDGLLAVFFFVAGLELKREVVVGDLRDPRAAVVPVAAAVGGVLGPILLYLAVNLPSGGGQPAGWMSSPR